MAASSGGSAGSGVLVVDKPADWTSHDVVARVRKLAGTRRVGHAGTLDPMATGVLVLGIDKGTRLLGHLTLTEKAYAATIQLGQSTNTDDAEGEQIARESTAAVSDDAVHTGVGALTGLIHQIPPQVSAIKVKGQRAYQKARAGERVELAARPVTVSGFTVSELRRREASMGQLIEIDATVLCSSGTYIRSLARDLGDGLGVGGHLTALRRLRVGPYAVEDSRTLDQLAAVFPSLSLAEAVTAAFPTRVLEPDEVRKVAHGNRVAAAGFGPGTVGLFTPDGDVVALAEESAGQAQPTCVFGAP